MLATYRMIHGHELNHFADLDIARCVYMRVC